MRTQVVAAAERVPAPSPLLAPAAGLGQSRSAAAAGGRALARGSRSEVRAALGSGSRERGGGHWRAGLRTGTKFPSTSPWQAVAASPSVVWRSPPGSRFLLSGYECAFVRLGAGKPQHWSADPS
ncbi:unnamed protein product [Caretta caretta]